MKKALITGANGFIGSSLVCELVKNNIEVIALVHNHHISNLKSNNLIKVFSYEMENIFELHNQLSNEKIDTFYHFAWNGSSGLMRSDIEVQLSNIKYSLEHLKFAKSIGCSKFINAGSIMEKEAMYNIKNYSAGYIYGTAKLAVHNMCKALSAEIGIEPIFATITNIYGIGEKSSRMVNTILRECIDGKSPKLTLGNQNYDFIYIDDAVKAFRLIGERGKGFSEYIIGSSNAKPLKEFLNEMKESIAPKTDFLFGAIPFDKENIPIEEYDCNNLEFDTGFKAEISFFEGCRRTYNWLKQEGGLL